MSNRQPRWKAFRCPAEFRPQRTIYFQPAGKAAGGGSSQPNRSHTGCSASGTPATLSHLSQVVSAFQLGWWPVQPACWPSHPPSNMDEILRSFTTNRNAGLPAPLCASISLSMNKGARALPIVLLLLSGCFSSPDAVREHTADLTAAAKRNAGAMVKGVFEGLVRSGPTNINRASSKDLQKLPGITPAQAEAIIANRPYDETSQLVRKRILSPSQYSRLRPQIVVR